jgi:alkanesulfonate monooxygenase SsuD/methylene tetrahydromethanopterin reductase-like flavin-dependent oxidoreductase (luciferase family)
MRLSIVDLAQIPPGGSAVEAFAHSVTLAQVAEQAGYHRFWLAEHHGIGAAVASCCPEALIARVASATTSIRVGSGTVLMNYSRPLRIAETYRSLHAMFPGRIDVGLGRADAPPVVDAALRGDDGSSGAGAIGASGTGGFGGSGSGILGTPGGEAFGGAGALDGLMAWMSYEDRVSEVMAWLEGAFSPDDPRSQVRLVPGVDGGPEAWLLGSSITSAMVAGRLGLRYGYAAFFNPAMAVVACAAYRSSFQPSLLTGGVEQPTTMLALNVCCADTNADADRLRASVELFDRDGAGPGRRPLVGADCAVAELGAPPPPTVPDHGMWPAHLSGDPERIRALIEQYAAQTQADEVVLQDLVACPDDRVRSYHLIAEAFALPDGQNSSRLSRNCSKA